MVGSNSSSSGSSNRAAIVTGAALRSGGLGYTIARRLVEDGVSVLLADADGSVEESASNLRQLCAGRAEGPRVEFFVGDLSNELTVTAMVEEAVTAFGKIDILVNNAGGGIIRGFLEHDSDSLHATIARNLWTAIWCCHKVLPFMVVNGHGRIVNIGADSVRTGLPLHAAYNAAKAGVVGLTTGLARDWAHLDITINVVSPCVIGTERFRARLLTDVNMPKEFLGVVPKGRPAELAEVVDLVQFLARSECAFITGQEISVNGGSAMP